MRLGPTTTFPPACRANPQSVSMRPPLCFRSSFWTSFLRILAAIPSPAMARPLPSRVAGFPGPPPRPDLTYPRTQGASAAALVEILGVRGFIRLRDGDEAGADVCLDRLALQGRDGLVDTAGSDLGRLLCDERLHDTVVKVLNALRLSVETHRG